MKRKVLQWIVILILAAIAFVYLTLPYKTVKNILGIGLGLRHNDHVMIGTVALIIAVVGIYRNIVKR
ncbi:hypothetical protein HYU13_05290 [Candidatus Woesearchaeota archaeon]|nr:hypothetical protein [Candidatus Woesearchaeota archaeon]